jgi:hypothetical protein
MLQAELIGSYHEERPSRALGSPYSWVLNRGHSCAYFAFLFNPATIANGSNNLPSVVIDRHWSENGLACSLLWCRGIHRDRLVH